MEVNANEMVIKSDFKEEMLADIKETLERLRVINLKLNPKKCSFGIEEGRFLGHLITKQGIKLDPSKVKAISDLQPPKSISEMQSLSQKLAEINCFLSNRVDKTLPFMWTLKNCMSGKMIQWTTEADEAFRRMKELLEALPTVTASVNGETLIVYLVASEERISAVLMTERGKKQVPMYFISRTIHKAELEYPELEKLILALKDREIKDGEAKRKEPEPENAWKLFIDGGSGSDGFGAGLMMVNPEGKEYSYALRFEFETTHNEAEYEALLEGLRIAKEIKIQELIIFLEKAKELLASFPTYSIEHIKRDQNKKADALNKLALMTFSKLAKEVLVEVLQEKLITQKEVAHVTQEEDDWMIPIREFLQLGKLPDDPKKARKLQIKAPLYKLMDGTMYRRSYLSPWLRCVGAAQAKNIIQEDAKELIQKCETCQIHSPVPRKPKQEMTSIMFAWPFSQWGIDIVGPLPMAPGGARFLVVEIDYFTKWVEAKPLISTIEEHMERFVWEYIVCRFGVPQIVISDNRKQFVEGTFPIFCQKLKILQAFTSVYHPKANRQVEVTNREIVKGMERKLGKTHQGWVDELPQVL
ncbi:reverse transcriptase domain-containing protein [Tanacetum coccineum]